jgi:signal transduction histidine kinase
MHSSANRLFRPPPVSVCVGWTLTVYALPPLLSAALAATLAYEGWRHRDEAVARSFVVLMVAIAVWSTVYAVQLGFETAGAQLLWARVATSFGGAVPVIWVVLAASYAGYDEWTTRTRVAALAAEPVALAALLWTNDAHGLVWRDVRFDPSTAPVVVDPAMGPAYVAHLVFAYALVLAGIAMLVVVFVRSGPVYRRQSGLLVVGAVVPLTANVASTMGLSPVPNLDLTTSTFALTGVVFGLALFRFDLLNLTPVARRNVVTEFGAGLVVVDRDDQVVEFNDVASAAVAGLERFGQDLPELLGMEDLEDVEGRVVTAEFRGRSRAYELGVTTLRDYRENAVGQVVGLQDVTARREYEQRLEVVNRMLRHNIRNEMTKVIGLAGLVADDTSGEPAVAAERIADVAEAVAEMGEKARRIETTLAVEQGGTETVALEPVLASVVEDCRAEWPSASVSLSVADDPAVRTPGEDLLESALQNVLENALSHSDRAEPTVEVSAEPAGEEVVVRVADDGPGIPEMERTALDVGRESALEHTSGLGLWLAHWVTTASGGTLRFEPNEPRGSVVEFRLPAPDDQSTASGTATP